MTNRDTDQDPDRIARLRREGYKLVREEFGGFRNGKSTRAHALAERLRAQGKAVYVDDGIWHFGRKAGGVRVYAKG